MSILEELVNQSPLFILIMSIQLAEILKEADKSDIEYIDADRAVQLILSAGTRAFDVVFTKKDGSTRRMNAMRGVKKHLTGGTLKYNPADYKLISVFDLQNKGYRMIPKDRLKSLRMDGQKYVIKR